MQPLPRYLGTLLALALLAGCQPSGPATYDVAGIVTWNGKPLPQGDIVFEAVDGKAKPSAGKIIDGAYGFRATEGTKRVQIHASRPSAKVDAVMGTAAREPYIPDRYNARTVLTAEVVPGGDNHFTFDLNAGR